MQGPGMTSCLGLDLPATRSNLCRGTAPRASQARRHSATAQAALGARAGGGDNVVSSSGGGGGTELEKLQSFFAAPAGQGAPTASANLISTISEAGPSHRPVSPYQPDLQYGHSAGLPAVPLRYGGVSPYRGSRRRHLRRRQPAVELLDVDVDADASVEPSAPAQPVPQTTQIPATQQAQQAQAQQAAQQSRHSVQQQEQQQQEQQRQGQGASTSPPPAALRAAGMQQAVAPAQRQVQAAAPQAPKMLRRAGQAAENQSSGAAAAVQNQMHALQRLTAGQLANLQQAAQHAQQHMAALARRQRAAQPRQQGDQQAARLHEQQQVQRVPQQSRQVYQAVAAPGASPDISAAAVGRWVAAHWAWGAALAAALLALRWLRWLRGKGRHGRTQQEIREAEQRAQAAKRLAVQRQRFQRALAAAEGLEGGSGMETVVPAWQQQGASSAAAAAAGAAAGAAAVMSMDGEDGAGLNDQEEGEGSTDVFDPASWDEDTRRQWESFVSSSKVNKGKLWDTSQVDDGLPEVWVDLNRD